LRDDYDGTGTGQPGDHCGRDESQHDGGPADKPEFVQSQPVNADLGNTVTVDHVERK